MPESQEAFEKRVAEIHLQKQAQDRVSPPRLKAASPATLIHKNLMPGEPYFVLRAQDILSSFGIEAYLNIVEKFADPNSRMVVDCVNILNQFREWQSANPDKIKLSDR